MVLSKRKRKDNINVPVTPTTTNEEPKRTRVQAQRKYAQGQPVPTSVYLAFNSEPPNPVKENSNPPVDVLPNQTPSTEDFIKYICFRNTSMCPKEFDFSEGASTSEGPSTSKATKEEASSKKSAKESTPKTVTKNHEITVDKNPSPKFMAFAARKRAEKFPEKKPLPSTSENSNKKKQQNKIVNTNKNKSNGNESRCTENSVNENSTTDKEESAKKRLRLKHAHSSSSLNDSSIVKSRKLDKSVDSSSHSNLNDVKIVLDKTDVDKEIEKNKSVPNKVSSESKSKKVPVQNDKRNTRLSALRNNSATPTSFEMKKDDSNKEEVDFSSDDEKPLISATENKTKLAKNPGTSLPSKTSTIKDKKTLSSKSKTENEKEKETNSIVETPESISDNKPKKRGRKKAQISPPQSPTPEVNAKKPNVSSAENEKPKVGRKKKKTADAEIAELSQANTTDLSENEAKPGRPTRKTKEAATIYMELIGRKLTLHDFSDNDSSSLDSLELPNFKKMEQMENELKANAGKNKGSEKKEYIVEKIVAVQTSTPKAGKETVKIESKNSSKQEKESPAKKIDKSFDDSDEEPLAVKLGIEKKPPPKKRGRKSNKEKSEMLAAEALNKTISEKIADKTVDQTTSFDKTNSILPSSNFQSPKTINSLDISNAAKVNETFDSQKTGKTNENFQVKSNQLKKETKTETDEDFMKSFDSGNIKPISLVPKSSINLLPSKEESEKIFGIASVTLAQSSGPLDTKCTLGKCGFVHKPPLGPAVLTETALGANLSPKDRRKSKVNMTREQIQKWLDETSWTPIPDELDDDYNDVFDKIQTKSKPSNSSAVTSVTSLKSKDAKDSNNSNDSIPTPSTSKGPTLKAKAIALVPEPTIEKSGNFQALIDLEPKQNEKNKKTDSTKKVTTPTVENKSDKINLDKSMSAETKKSANQAKNDKTASTPKSSVAASDRKPIYNAQQRKTPVYKAMEQKAKSPGALLNAFGAFSADNEHSVYSFDKEDDDIPATTPFRRCSRQESSNSKAEDSQQKKEIFDTFQKPQNLTPGNTTPNKQQISTSQVSLTLSPEESKKSASISVLQSEDVPTTTEKKETAVADKTENDSDSEGHTFYIPLQTTNVSGSKNDQLIQGVAVKLGTEGAEGPNQRIIMHAKLVTKSRIGMSSAPLPESMTNVQELVKTLMAGNKDATTTKPVPCATVQPRFKTNDTFEDSSQQNDSLPSTSAMPNRSKPSINVAKNPCDDEIQPTNSTVFPGANETASMVEAPIFRPTEKEFQDPIEYIQKITPIASRFGICKIIPPESFKPECRVADEMRFTASNQYVHKMLHRWGPSAKEFAAIKKYLATQSIVFQHPPLIAGMEVDLPRLYHTVQELGGLKEVIEKKKWAKVAEDMCIPKSAHDRVTKLDDIYCKYLLPYDTLSHSERQKLFDEVEADWAKREAKARRNADKGVESDDQSNEEEEDESDEDDSSSLECMVKGRSMALSQFFRIARNTMALWFKNNEPSVSEIENEYWRHVAVRDSHVCVHYGSIDSSGFGYGFPSQGPKMKSSPCSKHPWNLKVLTNNTRSVIRSLGPITGVTVPTLHVGMLFSAVCWYRDPHGLPWIEYLHTGANKIWYAVPDEQSSNFRTALTALAPSLCQNKTIWLPCDTVMVPPVMLTDRGVSLCRTEQEPGQFVVVFSRAYTSSLCTGYTVSESVYFATSSWLNTAHEDFMDITESSEPSMFSLEQLILAVANDGRSSTEIVTQILPMLTDLYEKEKKERQNLKDSGVTKMEKVNESRNKALIDELECSCCRANLHTSWIKLLDDDEETIYCLKHALKYINENRIQTNQCKLMYTYSVDDIKNLLAKLNTKISTLIQSAELASMNSSETASNSKKKTNAKIKHGIATLIK